MFLLLCCRYLVFHCCCGRFRCCCGAMNATSYNTGAEIDEVFDHFDTGDNGMLVDRESITQVATVFASPELVFSFFNLFHFHCCCCCCCCCCFWFLFHSFPLTLGPLMLLKLTTANNYNHRPFTPPGAPQLSMPLMPQLRRYSRRRGRKVFRRKISSC